MLIAALILLALLTALPVAGARLIPWRFQTGRHWMGIPFKMAFPALVWPMALTGGFSAIASLLLALLTPAGPVIRCIAALLAVVAAGACITLLGYIRRATAPHDGFARAFGPDWQARLPKLDGLLPKRWSPARYPDRAVRLERDLVIWTYPEPERQLLADLWQPPAHVTPTGVAFLFFHGSAWHFGDKGMGTDPMFRHLAAQGHLVLDVAYRLAPEVDIRGMVGDVKRAVAFMKQSAGRYGVDPERIVVGGASAGGHISLLAAYGNGHPDFTPAELAGVDTSVRGVISLYGPVCMRAYMEHEAGRMGTTGVRATARQPIDFSKGFPTEQAMFNLLGGLPDEVPYMYDLAAVATHVTPGGPPVLILQGEVDFITQTAATRRLVERLHEAKVPTVYLELPQTDHAWDVITGLGSMTGLKLPAFLDSQYAPPTTATIYDIERFLALASA